MIDLIKTMTPVDIFVLFDEEENGYVMNRTHESCTITFTMIFFITSLISFEEFRKMLPFLNININDAKAYRYFRLCDTDGSGQIDIDEFRVALFTCDPTSGNPVGFRPSSFNTPLGPSLMFFSF